jgi:hypothetical protein
MKNIELFRDPFYQIPKHYEGEFSKFVKDSLDEYIRKLNDFESWLKEDIEKNRLLIERLCNAINTSIDFYLKGLSSRAFITLSEILQEIKPFLLYPTEKSILLGGGNIDNFFRIRESSSTIGKDGIFHIPYKSRHNTQSYRFSIPGLPCLYLSNSVFLCWEETGKPMNKRLYCSRFEIDRNILKTLNLSFTPDKVLNMYSPKEHDKTYALCKYFITRALITWPILFASSIHTKCQKDKFKVEYIIPQLLMQWCLENNDIDGIRYFSVRSRYSKSLGLPLYQDNIALPAKINLDNVLCSNLKKKIKLSEPQLIKSYNYLKTKKVSTADYEYWANNNAPGYLNFFGRGFITNEKQPSIYEKFEIELLKQPVDFIK